MATKVLIPKSLRLVHDALITHLGDFETQNRSEFDFSHFPAEIDGTFFFISTHGLYERTKKAGCSFEKGIAYNILTQLLVHFVDDFGFHEKVRGCIMDYCEEHSWMIKGLKKMKLCRECTKAIKNEDLKTAVSAILGDPLRV